MSQAKHNLFSILLIIATIGVWHSPLGSYQAIAQASLISASSLQDEQSAEILTANETTLPTVVDLGEGTLIATTYEIPGNNDRENKQILDRTIETIELGRQLVII